MGALGLGGAQYHFYAIGDRTFEVIDTFRCALC